MADIKITHNLHNPEDKKPEEEQKQLHHQEVVVPVEVEEEEEEEEEEALSLCDLPLSKEDQNNVIVAKETTSKRTLRSSSEPSDLFEFFSPDLSSDCICSADDIIFAGKLIPLNEQHPNSPSNQSKVSNQIVFRKRSESLSALHYPVSRSNSAKSKFVRNSHSLDYRKIHLPSTSPSLSPEQSRKNRLVKSDAAANKKVAKPRWYVLMFGMVKFPAEMELNDIKSRQFRKNPLRKFPANSRAARGSGSWKLLKALSCKDHASVPVTASFCLQTA